MAAGTTLVTVVPQPPVNVAGTARLHIAGQQHPGHNTLGTFDYEDTGAVASEDLEVTTLDALGERLSLDRLEIVKIDVEGTERKVLTGGRRLAGGRSPSKPEPFPADACALSEAPAGYHRVTSGGPVAPAGQTADLELVGSASGHLVDH